MTEDTQQQVQAFLEEMQRRYGLSDDDVRELVRDWRWLRDYRARMDRYGGWIAHSIIIAIMSGLVVAVWAGIRSIVTR